MFALSFLKQKIRTMKKITTLLTALCVASSVFAQKDIKLVVAAAKAKLDIVNNYKATGRMKTNVAFLKVPIASVTIFYKKPNKLKVKSEKGISFIPKGAVNINMSNLTTDNNFTVIDAGTAIIAGKNMRVAKLLPNDDASDIVLSTVYIDEASSLIYKAKTTTRDNGSYELDMTYGKYASYALPDKILFSFNTKDYKLPKGVTFDFETGNNPPPAPKVKNRKGTAELTISSYIINKGVSDADLK